MGSGRYHTVPSFSALRPPQERRRITHSRTHVAPVHTHTHEPIPRCPNPPPVTASTCSRILSLCSLHFAHAPLQFHCHALIFAWPYQPDPNPFYVTPHRQFYASSPRLVGRPPHRPPRNARAHSCQRPSSTFCGRKKTLNMPTPHTHTHTHTHVPIMLRARPTPQYEQAHPRSRGHRGPLVGTV